jgi:NTP pyrophosphatase (non-canonical NTP hydrolase)
MLLFETLRLLVIDWAENKRLIKPENQLKQALKMVSEVGELCDEVIKENTEAQKSELGDVLVTVIILAEQLDIDPIECLQTAYDKIKDRKGQTVNGTFIKE